MRFQRPGRRDRFEARDRFRRVRRFGERAGSSERAASEADVADADSEDAEISPGVSSPAGFGDACVMSPPKAGPTQNQASQLARGSGEEAGFRLSAFGPAPLSCPSLLFPEPRLGLQEPGLLKQLHFAFAGGEAEPQIADELARQSFGPGAWDPRLYASQLFLAGFVEVLAAPLGLSRTQRATLTRLLSHPPADPAVGAHRAALLQAVADAPEALLALHRLLDRLIGLRARFQPGYREQHADLSRRRLQLLAEIRAMVLQLKDDFGRFGPAFSGLSRAGEAIAESPAYQALAELLDHEAEAATAEFQIQLGMDGSLRRFSLLRISSHQAEKAPKNWLGRPLGRFFMWLRGLRVTELELLDRWIDQVYAGLEPFLPGLLQLEVEIQFVRLAEAFRQRAQDAGLSVCLPVFAEGPRELRGLFNPLLLVSGAKVVPADLSGPGPGSSTLLTGPNSGGKTRLLQSIGFAQLFAQLGFWVPAQSAQLSRAPALFCSLVDTPKADQAEGRLGSELLRIRQLFEDSPPQALVLLDELCSGTNPSEGEDLVRLVLDLLDELGPECFLSTHFLGLATELYKVTDAAKPGAKRAFLQVELTADETPTYGFVPGVAQSSLAQKAAARLGVTREALLALIRAKKEKTPKPSKTPKTP